MYEKGLAVGYVVNIGKTPDLLPGVLFAHCRTRSYNVTLAHNHLFGRWNGEEIPMTWTSNDAHTIREMIYKETEYVNYRITWLVTLQGLLFAALGFAWKDGKPLIIVLGLIGIFVSISSAVPMHLAQHAILNLKGAWDKNKPDKYDGPDVIGYYSSRPLERHLLSWLSPWHSLPVLFVIGWIAVLWIDLMRSSIITP
jgi:hypothetical protein